MRRGETFAGIIRIAAAAATRPSGAGAGALTLSRR